MGGIMFDGGVFCGGQYVS